MPFTITIAINKRQITHIYGHNCGPKNGNWYNTMGTFIYHYFATDPDSGEVTEGEVLHVRSEGMEKLAAIILEDLSGKIISHK